jgi:membrane glycosyltransferase
MCEIFYHERKKNNNKKKKNIGDFFEDAEIVKSFRF